MVEVGFRKVDDEKTQRALESLRDALNELGGVEILDGTYGRLPGQTSDTISITSSGVQRVEHALGRIPVGFIRTWGSNISSVRLDTNNPPTSRYIWLNFPTANADYKIWIF